jgi:uncharacterized membrane protein
MSFLIIIATFLAATVEWVEALTIVLAAGVSRNWRSALTGAGAAAIALLALVAIFGTTIRSFPIGGARTAVGILLLLFGLKWLHKACLRASGLKALHDEKAAFEETTAKLRSEGAVSAVSSTSLDRNGVVTAFSGVFLEGLEVVFIVLALGGLKGIGGAVVGAVAALVVVVALGFILRAPLTRVPENAMKFVVGLMLTSLGTFFTGEGIGVKWWHSDVSILLLVAAYSLAAFILVRLLSSSTPFVGAKPIRAIRIVVDSVWDFFIGDGALALVTGATLLGVALFTDRTGEHAVAGLILTGGILLAVIVALANDVKSKTRAQGKTNDSSTQLRTEHEDELPQKSTGEEITP